MREPIPQSHSFTSTHVDDAQAPPTTTLHTQDLKNLKAARPREKDPLSFTAIKEAAGCERCTQENSVFLDYTARSSRSVLHAILSQDKQNKMGA